MMLIVSFTGVGAGMNPPKYLVPGTQMDVSISGIGTLRNNVVFAEE
jgi:2-keto-4-pentenoate hydratase/2-oxohepta-3-ene-1,7-dioic acid hydratase in catechol pathway